VERVIDSREKLNLPFRHPEKGFFVSLLTGIEAGEIVLYDPAYPDFSQPLSLEDLHQELYQIDTLLIYNPETWKEDYQVVENGINSDDVFRYRIREITYFDKQTSTQRTRIIGIAPLLAETDEFGNTLFERPIGWIYWPYARSWFDRQAYYLDNTDQAVISWGDALEMRRFDSYITKRSNVREARLQDNFTGRDLLVKSQQADRDLSNREHDLWSW
ncbi:MAG: gliding motility protein GldN, partial [Bacteroidota bacterium]